MSISLTKCVKHLDVIRQLPVQLRKSALSKLACDSCYYKSLKEIAKNIVKKNLKPTKLIKIKRNWKNIVELSGVKKLKKRNKKTKKQLVIQSGGWIWSVIPLVLSLLQSIK